MSGRLDAVLARRGEIMRRALGMDYAAFERGPIAFDYEAMMTAHGYSLKEIAAIQARAGVGRTPLLELRNLTDLVRSVSASGKGARLFVIETGRDDERHEAGGLQRAHVGVVDTDAPGVAGAGGRR